MKKFLSLLLALTMVMSLVIVPARAEGVEVGGHIRHHHVGVLPCKRQLDHIHRYRNRPHRHG